MTVVTSLVMDKERRNDVAAAVHKLKLQWVIAMDEAEKSRISLELRRLYNPQFAGPNRTQGAEEKQGRPTPNQ